MKKRLALLLVFGSLAHLCGAEPRWCSVSGRDSSNTLVYPPIAKAARVWGRVTGRIVYSPNGKAVRFEPIWGPAMLSRAVDDQLAGWTVKTDARGDELCETLVIASFRLHGPGESLPPEPAEPEVPSILRVTVEGEYVIISDPAITVEAKNPLSVFGYKIKRAVQTAFGHHRPN